MLIIEVLSPSLDAITIYVGKGPGRISQVSQQVDASHKIRRHIIGKDISMVPTRLSCDYINRRPTVPL